MQESNKQGTIIAQFNQAYGKSTIGHQLVYMQPKNQFQSQIQAPPQFQKAEINFQLRLAASNSKSFGLSRSRFRNGGAVEEKFAKSAEMFEQFRKVRLHKKNISDKQRNRPKEKQSLLTFLNLVIWIFYLLSTANQTFSSMTLPAILDILAMVSAVIKILINLIKHKQLQFSDIFHMLSLVCNITLILYSPEDDTFIKWTVVIRCLRLLFPVCHNYSLSQVGDIYGEKLRRLAKVQMIMVLVLTISAIVLCHTAGAQTLNRCRDGGLDTWPNNPIDDRLCGYRECSKGKCSNPLFLDLDPSEDTIGSEQQLGYNVFNYNNFRSGFIASFSVASLNYYSLISNMFFDSYFPIIILIELILTVVFYKCYAYATLIVLFKRNQIIEAIQNHNKEFAIKDMKRQEQNQERRGSGSGQEFLGKQSFGKMPTFQKNLNSESNNNNPVQSISMNNSELVAKESSSVQQNQKQPKKLQQIIEPKKKKISMQQSLKQTVKTSSFAPVSNISSNDATPSLKTKIIQVLVIIFLFLMISMHFVLNFIFNKPTILSQSSSESLGIVLGVLFIFWTIGIMIKVYVFGIKNQGESNAIIKIEGVIYLVALGDYFVRIMDNGGDYYSTTSLVSPLATAMLLFRFYYIYYLTTAFFYPTQSHTFKPNIFANLLISLAQLAVLNLVLVISLSVLFSTISIFLVQQEQFSLAFIKFFLCFINFSWLNGFSSPQTYIDSKAGFTFVILSLLIGEFILVRFIIAQYISKGFVWMNRLYEDLFGKYQQSGDKYADGAPTSSQQLEHLKTTKSLLCMQFNCLRQNLYTFITSERYQSFRKYHLMLYILFTTIGQRFAPQQQFFIIVSIMDVIILIDIFMTVVVRRATGNYSFTDGQWHRYLNLLGSIVIFVNLCIKGEFFLGNAFRVCRVFFFLDYFDVLRSSLDYFEKAVKQLMPAFAVMLLVIYLFNFMFLILHNLQLHDELNSSALSAFYNTLFLHTRGITLTKIFTTVPTSISLQHLKSFVSIELGVLDILIFVPINCLFIGCCLHFLKEMKLEKDMILFNKKKDDNLRDTQRSCWKKIEEDKVKSKILGIQPQVCLGSRVQKSFLVQLVSENSQIYQRLKLIGIGLSALMPVLLTNSGTILSNSEMVALKAIRLFFFIIEVSFFVVESFAFEAKQPGFIKTTIIIISGIPGSFIMFIPGPKISSDPVFKIFFNTLVMLVPVGLIGLFGFFGYLKKIRDYLFGKLNVSIDLFYWLIIFSLVLGGFAADITDADYGIVSGFNTSFIGLVGGDYLTNAIDQVDGVAQLTFLQIYKVIVYFLGFALRNFIIAAILFELSQLLGVETAEVDQLKNLKKELLLTEHTYQSTIDKEKLIDLWRKLDPKGFGVISVRLFLVNIQNFIKCFYLPKLYIQFLVDPKNCYESKLFVLKRMNIPLYKFKIKDEEQKKSEYAVSIYDIVLRMVLMRNSQNFSMAEQGEENRVRKETIEMQQYFNEEWKKNIIKKIFENNNRKKQQKSEIEFTRQIPSTCQMASVIYIMPSVRRWLDRCREKLIEK